MNKCTRCNSIENLIANAKTKKKNGEISISYICRTCNTERAKKYRATEHGKARIYAAVYRSTAKHIDKQLARVKLNYYLRLGKVIKPDVCVKCNEVKKLEAHHDDYSKPLEVLWMCRPCHSDHHKWLTKQSLDKTIS
jgi:hypothetical protein